MAVGIEKILLANPQVFGSELTGRKEREIERGSAGRPSVENGKLGLRGPNKRLSRKSTVR